MNQQPLGDFACVAVDPPWLERGGGKSKRGADRHYPLMDKKMIVETVRSAPVWRPAADCHLWMWATSNFLKDALWVMELLDFRYVTSAVWVKVNPVVRVGHDDHCLERPYVDLGLQIGLGQYMRHAHEWLLFGTRGQAAVPPPQMRQPSVIFAPRTKHSAKPQGAYNLIECTSPEPRLEMFARMGRVGWDVWGNEVCNHKAGVQDALDRFNRK